eukprot:4322650-Amphidinium_carterae.1
MEAEVFKSSLTSYRSQPHKGCKKQVSTTHIAQVKCRASLVQSMHRAIKSQQQVVGTRAGRASGKWGGLLELHVA